MRLHLRKAAQAQIEMTRDTPFLPGLDFLEEQLLDAASEEQAEVGLGRMVVISTQLLEIARRADPAYGLPPVYRGKPHAHRTEQ
jgi:hypothetical protein